MKFHVCLIFAAVCLSSTLALIAPEAIVMLRGYEDHCVRLSDVSRDHLEMARLDRKIYEEEHLEKFAVCMLKKFNIMNMDGSINENSNSYQLITDNPESFMTANKCKDLAGKDVRETARKIMTCFLQSDIIAMDPQPNRSLP